MRTGARGRGVTPPIVSNLAEVGQKSAKQQAQGTKVLKRFDKETRSENGVGAKQKSKPCLYASYLSYLNLN